MKTKFFILSDVIFLVRLQGKFKIKAIIGTRMTQPHRILNSSAALLHTCDVHSPCRHWRGEEGRGEGERRGEGGEGEETGGEGRGERRGYERGGEERRGGGRTGLNTTYKTNLHNKTQQNTTKENRREQNKIKRNCGTRLGDVIYVSTCQLAVLLTFEFFSV